MSLNDRNLGVAAGVDIHDGMANPTASSNNSNPMETNFVNDPTTPARGAGAGPHFEGNCQAAQSLQEAPGVIEARPGIIESSNIDPLDHKKQSEADDWANTITPGGANRGPSKVTETTKSSLGSVKETILGKK